MENILPTEVWIRIFQLLSHEDLHHVRLVCKFWNSITNLIRSNANSIRLKPSNCSDVFKILNESPSTLRNRMVKLTLVRTTNSVQLKSILEMAANWIESLTLIDAPIYQSLPQRMDRLYELSLADIRNECGYSVLGYGIAHGIASCTNFQLRELYLNGIRELDERCLQTLVQRLPYLEHLTVCGCTNALTDNTLTYVFSCLTELKSLELDDCYRISGKCFQISSDFRIQQLKVKNLHKLSLRGCYQITVGR